MAVSIYGVELGSVLFMNRCEGLLHHGAQRAGPIRVNVEDISLGDDEPLTRLQYASNGMEVTACFGSQEIDFVFDGRHFSVYWGHGEARVTTRDVCQSTHGTTMKTALLLRHFVAKGQAELAPTRLNGHEVNTELLHHALPSQT